MQVKYGQVCPEGFLPAYSVDSEEMAKKLVTLCCSMGIDGEYYASELVNPMTGDPYEGNERIDAFVKFGQKLERVHKMILEREKKS